MDDIVMWCILTHNDIKIDLLTDTQMGRTSTNQISIMTIDNKKQ